MLVLEYFPAYRFEMKDTRPSPFTKFLQQSQPMSFVRYPDDFYETLSRLPWHSSAEVGGASGYFPPGRREELRYFDANFPSPESLLLLERWGTNRVFVSATGAASLSSKLTTETQARSLWSGHEGTLYEFRDLAGSYTRFLAAKGGGKAEAAMLDLLQTKYPGKQPEFTNPGTDDSPFVLSLPLASPVDPLEYTRFTLEYTASQWYNLVQSGLVQWTSSNGTSTELRGLPIAYQIDGKSHQVQVNLGESIDWITSSKVTELKLVLFGAKTIKLHSMRLESLPVDWQLPAREL